MLNYIIMILCHYWHGATIFSIYGPRKSDRSSCWCFLHILLWFNISMLSLTTAACQKSQVFVWGWLHIFIQKWLVKCDHNVHICCREQNNSSWLNLAAVKWAPLMLKNKPAIFQNYYFFFFITFFVIEVVTNTPLLVYLSNWLKFTKVFGWWISSKLLIHHFYTTTMNETSIKQTKFVHERWFVPLQWI